MTLIHMATQQPDRVEAMILIGGTNLFPKEARAILQKFSMTDWSAEQLRELRALHPRDQQLESLAGQFHAFASSYDDVNFTRPYLSTISARTLIVHGDRDPFFPVEIPLELYRSIPNAYLWIVPATGHEFPDRGQFTTIGRAFLQRQQPF